MSCQVRTSRSLIFTRIAAINTTDGSTLGDNQITSHQLDYVSSVLIPAEAVENDQEHLAAIRQAESHY